MQTKKIELQHDVMFLQSKCWCLVYDITIILPLSFTNSFESQHQLFDWSQWSAEILLLVALSLPVPVIRKISGLAENTFGLYSVLLRCHEGVVGELLLARNYFTRQ